jgi:hypothetical protein
MVLFIKPPWFAKFTLLAAPEPGRPGKTQIAIPKDEDRRTTALPNLPEASIGQHCAKAKRRGQIDSSRLASENRRSRSGAAACRYQVANLMQGYGCSL